MKTQKIHRKYPRNNWEFRAISTQTLNKAGNVVDVIFGISTSNGIVKEGVEIYTGENYIVGATNASRSYRYEKDSYPKYYADIISTLTNVHLNTKWSTDDYVNEN